MIFAVENTDSNNVDLELLSRKQINEYWGNIVSSSDLNMVVELPVKSSNIFARTIELAFYKHYPLTLSPDVIHLQILHGLGNHIKSNPEKIGKHFKEHLELFDAQLFLNSPPEIWERNILKFETEIISKLQIELQIFTNTFTTTQCANKIACIGALMDTMQHYFSYGLLGGCGIPSIHLLGVPDDWKKLRESIAVLKDIDLGWWFDELDPVLEEFYNASLGNNNPSFWKSICRWRSESGCEPPITGWLSVFFPYIYGISEQKPDPKRDGSNPMIIELKISIRKSQQIEVYGTDTINILRMFAPVGQKRLIFNGAILIKGTLEENGISCGSIIDCVMGSAKSLVKNNLMSYWKQGETSLERNNLPPGTTNVPISYRNITNADTINLNFESGFIGIVQDSVTKSIQPKIGWIIKQNKC